MKTDSINHEESFIESFISRQRRPRWQALLHKKRGRGDFLGLLYGSVDALDQRCVLPIPSNWQVKEIVDRLRQLGASNSCYVFSNYSELDQKSFSIDDAVSKMLGHQMGSVASCIPGKLAYWEAEGPNDRIICFRT